MDKLTTIFLIALSLITSNITPSPANEIPSSTPNDGGDTTVDIPDVTTAYAVPVTDVRTKSSSPVTPVPSPTPETGSEHVPAIDLPMESNTEGVPPETTSQVVPLSDSPTVPSSEGVPPSSVTLGNNSLTSPFATTQAEPSSKSAPENEPRSNSETETPSPVDDSERDRTSNTEEDTAKESPRTTTTKKDNGQAVPQEIFTLEPTTSTTSRGTTSANQSINATSNEISYGNVTANPDDFTEIVFNDNNTEEDKYAYLIFSGDCDYASSKYSESEIEMTDFAERKDTLENGACKRQIVLKMTFQDDEARNRLKFLVGKMGLNYGNRAMKLVSVNVSYEYALADNSTNVAEDNDGYYVARLSYDEFVCYTVIACCFGSVLLIALCLLCLKCWRRGDKNRLTRDIPHLTLRLEDYALTRIPRPNTVYSRDSSKSPHMTGDDTSIRGASVQGLARSTDSHVGDDGPRMSRAYETEVVPLDDYENPYATPGYQNGTRNGNEMRTFHRQGHDQLGGGQAPKPSRGTFNNDSSSVTDSTEKLARDFYKRKGGGSPYEYGGQENLTYKTSS